MERIPQYIIDQMSQSLLGKRVQYRDIVGECKYFGYNEYLPKWGLQITLDRMPLSNVDIKQIFIVDEL